MTRPYGEAFFKELTDDIKKTTGVDTYRNGVFTLNINSDDYKILGPVKYRKNKNNEIEMSFALKCMGDTSIKYGLWTFNSQRTGENAWEIQWETNDSHIYDTF